MVRNFLTHHALPVDGFAIELLGRADTWLDPEAFRSLYPATASATIDSYLHALIGQGCLVAENSAAAALDAEYENFWAWDATAGLYHFGIQDPPWLNPQQSAQWQQHIAVTKQPVPLMMTNEGLERVEKLKRPDTSRGVMAIMKGRRSVRTYSAEAVESNVLRDCLFAGLGVTGFLNTGMAGDEPWVPLKMSPSGGGRNPFEAYVYVRNVTGLDPGLYHYSALDNSLGLMTDRPAVTTTQLFAGQEWTESAAFAILLVANFERPMWKYPHPNAYRVVLMEAGHIAQNISLVAAENSLCATPTAAVSDSAANDLLGLNRVRQALIHSVFIGHPHPEASERKSFKAHP